DPNPASATWTVDTTSPDTTIDSAPSGSTTSTSASISFSGDDGAGTGVHSFRCSLDGALASACNSPADLTGLADGVHTFTVSAVDAVSNAAPTPASASWTVDTTAPSLPLDSGPSGSVASASATFAFTAESGATVECRLDGGTWEACSSPVSYPGLADGSHTF